AGPQHGAPLSTIPAPGRNRVDLAGRRAPCGGVRDSGHGRRRGRPSAAEPCTPAADCRTVPRMPDDLTALDATALAELVRRRDTTPPALVDAAIARIEALNPTLNAVIIPLFEKARAAAAGNLPDGPFRGVPLLLKDLLCYTAGDPTHMGTRYLR